MTISFHQGHTIDGCPFSISIIQGVSLGSASGVIQTKDGRRVRLPSLTAQQGSLFIETLLAANVSEVVSLLEGYRVN